MPTITKDLDCPECGLTIECDIDPEESSPEVECPDCEAVIPFRYDAATGVVELLEFDDEDEDEEDDEPILVGEDDDEEDEA